MARKYTRDNRGRFASKGTGATARGGRLKTASGNKRETQKRRIFSAESKKLGPAAVDAASRSGKVNLSRKYGGQGQGYKSRLGLSAAKAAKTAQEAARASKRQAGLPSSGGAMRLANGVGASKLRAKAALTREKAARAAYFKTDYGTKAQASAKAKLDAATKKADAKRNQWRDAKMARMDAQARKPMSAKRTKAAAPANTVANKTGQSKTLNRFNSRPPGTPIAVKGKLNLVPSKGRVPLDMGRGSDRAFARVATKAARMRAKSASRPDTAMVNIPMSGSRGRRLNAEITRNVKTQKATARAADKARNRQFQSDQSRAKKLRAAHVGTIAKAKGISKGQVESALKAQTPSTQIKALKNWVKQNRGAAKPAAKPAARKVDTTAAGIARRRARAMTERSSVAGGTFNMKLTTQSAITRSAANAIYNRQRVVARASGGKIDPSIARDGIGVVRGISGSRKDRAQQLREQARKRVVSGRRR